jgi:hypothetical protein
VRISSKTRKNMVVIWALVATLTVVVAVIVISLPRPPKYDPKLGWIEVAGPGASFHYYFVVTNQKCIPDKPLRSVGYESLGGEVTANVLPMGTRTYCIQGVDPGKAFAVELVNGNGERVYVKAINVGIHEPH